jgi:hypothetical protein
MNAGYFPNLDALAPLFLSLGFALLVEEMILGQHEQRMRADRLPAPYTTEDWTGAEGRDAFAKEVRDCV